MLDHVAIRAGDCQASERFYRTTLSTLGIEPTRSDAGTIAWEDFLLASADHEHPPTRHLHLGFVAPSREHVDEFWRAGRAAGSEDDGKPGERPQYSATYYGAFLLDPDGNSAEAVHHEDVRRGGHIDHLWIGVRDLNATVAFYSTLARHTGLRGGRRWEQGRQFRGAWATFSLMADGRPPTEGLQLAFPGPDRQTVEDFHREATAAGYREAGPPAEREGAYSASVLDPEGTEVVSVCRLPG